METDMTDMKNTNTGTTTTPQALAFIEDLIARAGFDFVGQCPAAVLKVVPAVRDMCAEDKCRSFGKSWSCPPACGTLEEFEALFKRYERCVVFQTTLNMEDDFDYETMVEAKRLHDERFNALSARVVASGHDIALLSAGTCKLCAPGSCTCPDAPCIHPKLMHPSMEAAGLWVSEVCTAAQIAYNHGPLTMTYTSCALV